MATHGESSSTGPSLSTTSAASHITTVTILTPEQAPTSSILCHFSRSQVALAFAIERSRPEGVSTIEYCQRLRKRINTGRNISNKEHRYVDSSDFWKDEYNTIYLEKKNLEDKVHRLEEELRLRRETTIQENSLDSQARSSIVRQLVAQSSTSTSDASKKRQLPHDLEILPRAPSNVDTMETSPADNNLLRMSSYALRISRERSNLEKIAQNLDPSNLQVAIAHSREFLLLVDTAITECCIPLQYLKTNTKDAHTLHILQQLMQQVSLAVQISFDFLNVLCRTIAGREKRNHVVYRIAVFFDKALGLLQQLSNMQAAYENKRGSHISLREPCLEEGVEYAVNKYLAGALSSTISNLKWEVGKPGHRPVLEGILYAVLKQTGRLVSEAIFQEHVGSSKNPGNITEMSVGSDSNTASLESRYIVQILYVALGGSARKGLVAEVLASENSPRTQRQHNTSSLLFRETNRIQNMLVKSAIGGDEFESLKFPASPIENIDIPIIPNTDIVPYGPVWFIERVWTMVGWDMAV
ncbi:uncharacterized protein BP5553_04041 [Venustampulla echinocandica]|uniref:Uncharacterized protein n=1 Tax=Venustampulla echinocandica TaxID=2656787 RepID=A0A370TVZ5_9HELO|nr:uncharacterized protein BP5553_04041 [Venustampulla echinocandica]RDL39701.1 hypothetical protein BP5553_04041 [Venustampulla echinocandica]